MGHRPQQFEHGGNIYVLPNRTSILDYSANINPLGLSDKVKEAILREIDGVVHYPDPAASALKQAISSHYQVAPEYITVGNGAVELLYILGNILRPRQVLVPAPTFSEYERACRAVGAVIDYTLLDPAEDFAVRIDIIINKIQSGRLDIVFICNPNNPTGSLVDREQLKRLAAAAWSRNTMVVVDESFMDFLPDSGDYTVRDLVGSFPNLVILHSLTKIYAIPGLRLGFMLSQPELTKMLHGHKDPWNVNSLAQAAGVAAINDAEYIFASRQLISAEKERFYWQLERLPGCRPFKPAANFILVDIAGTGKTASQLRQDLLPYGILIRDCSNYPGLADTYIRLAVKLPAQNDRLVEILKEILR